MLSEYLTLCSYFLIVILLNFVEHNQYKSWINPFFILSIPFSFVLLLCLVANTHIGFISFYINSLWIWVLGLSLFWLSGQVSNLLFSKKKYCIKKNVFNNVLLINVVFVMCLVLTLKHLVSIDSDFGGKDMGEEISIGGIQARMTNILLIALPFYTVAKINKTFKIAILLILTPFVISIGSKTWIMNAFLSSILVYNYCVNKKINIFLWLITFLILFSAFFLYYYLNTDIEDANHMISFILRHFYFYLTSGILPMGEYVRIGTNEPIEGIKFPIINVISTWFGQESTSGHSTIWYTTDTELGTQSNVFSLFGTLYIYGNTLDFIFYSLFFGFCTHFVYNLNRINGNVFISILNAYFMSTLFFGWFHSALNMFRIWEISIFCIILYIISKKQFVLRFNNKICNL